MIGSYLTHLSHCSKNVKIFLVGNAIQGIGLSIYGLLFNLYLKELGHGEASIGNLISTTSLGISLTAIPAALIIERFHVKHLVIAGMTFSSLFYFLQILHTDSASLFSFGLMASMFQALFNISIAPFYLRNSRPEMRVHLFTLNSALNIGAHFLGYLGGGFLPDLLKWFDPDLEKIEAYRSAIMIALGFVFSSNLLFMRIRKVPIPKSRNLLFQGLREKEWRKLSKLIAPKLCFAFGGGLVVPFINLYLKEKFNFSTERIGISYALLQLFIFIGIFITPSLIQKTTHLKFILYTSFLSIPFMLIMGLTGNIVLVLSCFFMRGMLMNMSSPITSMFEMEQVKENDCVSASALILFFYHLAYTTSTRLGGHMIETYSFGFTFYAAALFYGLAICLYYKFFGKKERSIDVEINVQTSEAA